LIQAPLHWLSNPANSYFIALRFHRCVPIARINPPDNNADTDKLTMKAMLIPVGFNEQIDRSRLI
jgi:hypothetical protein